MAEVAISIVLMSILTFLLGQIVHGVQTSYTEQIALMEAQDTARTAADFLVRLIRLAGNNPRRIAGLTAVIADPDGNGQWDSIRIQSDWNPPDGSLDDPFEDILFSTADAVLLTTEPGDIQPVEFLEGIQSIAFNYFDKDGNPIADPDAAEDSIVHVRIDVQIQPPGSAPQTLSSGATLRIREGR